MHSIREFGAVPGAEPRHAASLPCAPAGGAQACTSGRPRPDPSPLALREAAPHSVGARILFRIAQALGPHRTPATDGTGSSKIGRSLGEEVANALAQTRRLFPPIEDPHAVRLLASAGVSI